MHTFGLHAGTTGSSILIHGIMYMIETLPLLLVVVIHPFWCIKIVFSST
jgi:hypothetical protein